MLCATILDKRQKGTTPNSGYTKPQLTLLALYEEFSLSMWCIFGYRQKLMRQRAGLHRQKGMILLPLPYTRRALRLTMWFTVENSLFPGDKENSKSATSSWCTSGGCNVFFSALNDALAFSKRDKILAVICIGSARWKRWCSASLLSLQPSHAIVGLKGGQPISLKYRTH